MSGDESSAVGYSRTPDVLVMIEDMIIGRNNFFNDTMLRAIPFHQRPLVLSRYMNTESLYLEFINRVYLNNIQHQAAATALVTLTMPHTFMDPVSVTASRVQITQSLEDFPTTTSNCAICQDLISSGGCRIRQCGHVYHRACVVNWFSMSVRCPVCRHDIREVGQASQTSSVAEQTSSPQAAP